VLSMKSWVAFGFAALVGVGCGGSDSSAPPTSAAEGTNSVVVTAPATTTPPSTSTSTTVAPTTTLPATTTTVATEDLIKNAVQDYATEYHLCGVTPETCMPQNFTAQQGHSRATLTELSVAMTNEGLHFAVDGRGSYQVAESVTIVSSTEATATYCAFDAGTVLGPLGPDGLPTVVNDQIVSLRNEYRLYNEANRWQVGEQREIEELGQGSLCPPAA
jgi:hypothetical protein